MRGFIFSVLIIFLFSTGAFAQTTHKNLKTIDLSKNWKDVGITLTFNRQLISLPNDDILKAVIERNKSGEGMTDYAYPFNIKLSPNSDHIYSLVCGDTTYFSTCNLRDKRCRWDEDKSSYCEEGDGYGDGYPIDGVEFLIPGDNCIYTKGGSSLSTAGKQTGKTCLVDGKFKETKQPFNYVGQKSKTLADLQLYSDKDLKEPSTIIKKNHAVEVILYDMNFTPEQNGSKLDLFLVRDEYGIIGWCGLHLSEKASQTNNASEIKDLFFFSP